MPTRRIFQQTACTLLFFLSNSTGVIANPQTCAQSAMGQSVPSQANLAQTNLPQATSAEATPTPTGERLEILIVEDYLPLLENYAEMLGEDYIVHVAKNGAEGIEILRAHVHIVLVLSDLMMPLMDGDQLKMTALYTLIEEVLGKP